jgi:hypothetical protein
VVLEKDGDQWTDRVRNEEVVGSRKREISYITTKKKEG